MIQPFTHHKLDVYQVSLEFAQWIHTSVKMPYSLKDQALRASQSIVLNIAEGAAQRTSALQKRHYRVALASAAECSAILDFLNQNSVQKGKTLLFRIGCMLNKLAK